MKNKEEILIVPTEVGAKDLASVMSDETAKRTLITKYITQHMKEGADYGSIKIGGRDSKPSLFKPGSEKFMSLFKLTAKFEKDNETWEMAGSEAGLFAYKCSLIASNGNVVGEGRGVATMKEKAWSVNTCVKIAEKRAQIDAVLRTGALSDFFTQDLEDMVQEPMKPYKVERVTSASDDEAQGHRKGYEYPKHDSTNDASELPSEEKDKQIIKQLLIDLGKKPATWGEAKLDVKMLTKLTLVPENFEKIIEALRKLNLNKINNEALDTALKG